MTKTTADYDRWTLLKANEPTVVQMQSHWRGIMVRKEYQKRRQYLKEHEKDAVKIQAVWRGHKAQKSYKQRLEYLNQQKDKALLVGPCVIMVATHMYMYMVYLYQCFCIYLFLLVCVWCGGGVVCVFTCRSNLCSECIGLERLTRKDCSFSRAM